MLISVIDETLDQSYAVLGPMATLYLFRNHDGQWERCGCLTETKPLRMGRAPRNDIVVKDEDCSREHAEVFFVDNEFVIHDLQSRNGTFIDGKRISGAQVIRHATKIRIGQTDFYVSDASRASDLSENDASSTSEIKGTVSQWIVGLKESDGDVDKHVAQEKVVGTYFEKLVRLARHRLRNLQNVVEDEEDAALSALDSFFRAVDEDRFPKLDNREDLWRLLVTITVRKVRRQRERQMAQKRGHKTTTQSDTKPSKSKKHASVLDFIEDKEHKIIEYELIETLEHSLDMLGDPALKQIAQQKLEGKTNSEIGAALKISKRTVDRKLAIIRGSWQKLA